MCPLCPAPNGTTITVDGVGSFTIPFDWNAKSFTITIPAEGDKSTVVWDPCGHVVIVDGRVDTAPERPVGSEETNR
jgi:hypothetical protein